MAKERIDRSKRAFSAGAYLNFSTAVFSFVIRSMLIRYIGIEYTGISGLFASLLQIFNLVDLGIDATAASLLYAPVADNDVKKINAIMCTIRKVYFAIGLIIILVFSQNRQA